MGSNKYFSGVLLAAESVFADAVPERGAGLRTSPHEWLARL